jgi:cysteinyl-tRNA synthetase
MKIEELEKHRIEPREGKRNGYDFALWKGAKESEPSWEIELTVDGKKRRFNGRPGWHIEDTAITHAIFGKQYDLHGGAIELIFPHHTNEIAQAEAAFGVKPFVKYWMHSGIMLIKGEKMSKSLKNFIRIRELLKKFDAEALRLMVLSTHYRKDFGYMEDSVKKAAARINYMYASFSIFYNMKEVDGAEPCAEVDDAIKELSGEFKEAMDDDFNTPLAITKLAYAIDRLRSYAETHTEIGGKSKAGAIKGVLSAAGVLGLLEKDAYKERLPEEAAGLIKERERLRKDKKFKEADAIREKLKSEYSISVEDSEYGPIWYKNKR